MGILTTNVSKDNKRRWRTASDSTYLHPAALSGGPRLPFARRDRGRIVSDPLPWFGVVASLSVANPNPVRWN